MASRDLYLRVIASLVVALARRCSIYPDEEAVNAVLKELDTILGREDVEYLRGIIGEFTNTLRRALREGRTRFVERSVLEAMLSL